MGFLYLFTSRRSGTDRLLDGSRTAREPSAHRCRSTGELIVFGGGGGGGGVQNAALVGGAVAWTLSSPVHATSRRRNAYFSENDC